MNYLITGTGRCGTGYMSQVFTAIGLNCTHEGIFQPRDESITRQQLNCRIQNPSWGWRGESSWLATPFLHWEEFQQDWTIIHVMRHPKKVLDSMLRLLLYKDPAHRKYFDWCVKYFPEIGEHDNIIDQTAQWYISLFRRAQRYAEHLYRVEDNPAVLLDALGIEYNKDAVRYVPTDYNSRSGFGPSDVQLEDIETKLTLKLSMIVERFGYVAWNA